ncbi:hypothetical protein EV187_1445 [Agromyces ramosus]|uniref:Patatin-like phospholipase n=1 Tax=Agromyces ramosus TaxID=33879 RepID=A0A4Q7MEB4_9MICO|nr:hypothetical protein [Agromyces ramosus]RZS65743.1 hypothetical protein EV187_1445 [Agromyces ramosus]
MSGQPDSTTTEIVYASATTRPREPVIIGDDAWRRIAARLTWVAVAALFAVMLGELDRLIASVPAGDGRSHSLNVVLSPLGATKVDSWVAWAGAALNEVIGRWIVLSALLDLMLVLALVMLLVALIRIAPRPRTQVVPIVAVVAYASAEVIEDALQIAGGLAVIVGAPSIAGEPSIAHVLGVVMAVFTTLKALSLLVFAVAMLRIAAYRRELGRQVARIARAVWVHRLATLAILVIVVLACIPAADLLDQLPDVQRQWVDNWDGYRAAGAAAAALAATALVTFVLGRRRTRLAVETRAFRLSRWPARCRWDAAAPWLFAPAALVVAAVIVIGFSLWYGVRWGIHWPTFGTILILSGLVPVLAACGWKWVKQHPARPLGVERDRARMSWIVGDTLAVLVLVAGGIGIVRSFMVPVALLRPTEGAWAWSSTWTVFAFVVGACVAILSPLLLLPWLASWKPHILDPNLRATEPPPGPNLDPFDRLITPAGRLEAWSLFFGAAFLLGAMLVPTMAAWLLGGVAVTLFAISAWITVFGAFTLLVQPRELIAPFRWLRLKAAPVLTLGILLPFAINIVISAFAADRELHAVQVSNPSASVATGDPLEARLEELQNDAACGIAVPAPDGERDAGDAGEPDSSESAPVQVRPVYLIAAEGGGIRAAYWTATALAALKDCAARSGFVASGISGGSVGLAVASTIEQGGELDGSGGAADDSTWADEIVVAAKKTAGPDVVSTAVLGLAVGDMFAAGSGVRMPSFLPWFHGPDDEGLRWRDRAALVEALWERDAPGLEDAFSAEISPLTGMLMLSSTDVVSKCRLLVDQAPIAPSAPTPADATAAPEDVSDAAASGAQENSQEGSCDVAGGLPSMLGFRELAATGGADATTKCLASLDWSTAAMLSARFAIVTPTGGLPAEAPCNDAPKGAQFVDGGYVEPTSLAALADTAPRLMARIAEKNEERVEGEPWLLPMLVYLRNTQGYDLADDVARAESEPLVPITGGAAKGHLTAEDAWIQRITLAMPGACPDSEAAEACRTALVDLIGSDGLMPGGTLVIAPDSTPAVVPPLGWALSGMSQARFTSAIKSAAGCDADVAGTAAAESAADDEGEGEGDDVVTERGQYMGLAEFAENVVRFDPCPQVDAQERSQTAPAPAPAQ